MNPKEITIKMDLSCCGCRYFSQMVIYPKVHKPIKLFPQTQPKSILKFINCNNYKI